jgi:hypothetical protein
MRAVPAHRRGCNSSAMGGQGLREAAQKGASWPHRSDASEDLDRSKAAEAGELFAAFGDHMVVGENLDASSETWRPMRTPRQP